MARILKMGRQRFWQRSWTALLAVLALLAGAMTIGCGPSDTPLSEGEKLERATPEMEDNPPISGGSQRSAAQEPRPAAPSGRRLEGRPGQHRSLADLLPNEPDSASTERSRSGLDDFQQRSAMPTIDDARAAAVGLRKLTGKHLTLYTDLPADPEVDELPAVFDLAIPQWCEYFRVEPDAVESWQMIGSLMDRKEPFQAAGLLPDDLPPFLHGYQQDHEMWVYEQSSIYYSRHLLLHEGTHAFMAHHLGGTGPPWYMEGMAELLGTHLWQDGQLTLRHFPQHKDETPHWGRIKVIQDELAGGRGMLLGDIVNYGPRAHLKLPPYAWCWALAAFFDGHPQYRERFHRLQGEVQHSGPEFTQRFWRQFQDELPHINRQWQLFVFQMDYGYDVERAAIELKEAVPLPAEGATVEIAADRGWQSTGLQLEAGRTYEMVASGRYQVGDKPTVWWCEPGGVTIRYYRGEPLGMVVAGVCDDRLLEEGLTGLARPEPVGLGRQLTFPHSGTLYLQINESPAELADNAGHLTVRVAPKSNASD